MATLTSSLIVCKNSSLRENSIFSHARGFRSLVSSRKPLPLGVRCVKQNDELELSSKPSATKDSRLAGTGTAVAALALSLLQALSPINQQLLPGGAQLLAPQAANAVLYSPDTARLPKTGEVALRRSIPPVNAAMKTVQSSLEDIFFLLRIPQRKPYGSMESNVKKCIQLMTDNRDAIIAVVPSAGQDRAVEVFNQTLTGGRGSLDGLLKAIQLQDADKIASRLVATLDSVADLMLLEAPGLPYPISPQLSQLPRLTGRATAAFTVARGDGSTFTVAEGGGPQDAAVFEVVLDGFSAPLTSGNFATLVQSGAYDGTAFKVAPQAALGEAPPGAGRELPLEVMPAGEVAPIYRTPLDIQDGEIPVLPMSVFGSLAMSHSPTSDTANHPSQFFFYLYDKRNSGLGGLSFEEGQFSVFGYVTKGKDVLSQLKTGDIIKSAKLIQGEDRLIDPSSS